MASSSAAMEAQIRSEIERLTATINQHKAQNNRTRQSDSLSYAPYSKPSGRSNTYVNPHYKLPKKYVRPNLKSTGPPTAATSTSLNLTPTATNVSESDLSTITPASGGPVSTLGEEKKEIVLGGVAFESSRRSLVRKDLPKPTNPPFISKSAPVPTVNYSRSRVRKSGHSYTTAFKSKVLRGRNMTLNNTRRPHPPSRKLHKKKLVDKPCPRFTTTGTCSRGLTCMYQHDPNKIAICWNFLQGNCTKTAETCNLSHDPTPERTPLCLHFLNKGRCTRNNCPFPHINVGPRDGVCRDFAVLGYCGRGLNCDKQHVRECPEFAEKGTCGTRGCKLPHVIRANRNRKAVSPPPLTASANGDNLEPRGDHEVMVTVEDGQLGDEYISLTFQESDSEGEEGEEEEESVNTWEGEGSESESEKSDMDIQVHM